MAVAKQRVGRGLAVARRYLGIRYRTWRPGMRMVVTGPPSRAQMIRRGGAVCADVCNTMKLASGQRPPGGGGVLQGGVLAYQRRYGRRSRRYRRGAWYPAGTMFIVPYTGPALRHQGHVSVSTHGGRNPNLIQSTPRKGWHVGTRLYRMKRPVWAILPKNWLGLQQ